MIIEIIIIIIIMNNWGYRPLHQKTQHVKI